MNIPVLVFESGGFLYVYADSAEASSKIEAIDLLEGFYLAAFGANGERLQMRPADDGIFVDMVSTGSIEIEELRRLLREWGHPGAAEDPEVWATLYLQTRDL